VDTSTQSWNICRYSSLYLSLNFRIVQRQYCAEAVQYLVFYACRFSVCTT
jgi:hypothetical protein